MMLVQELTQEEYIAKGGILDSGVSFGLSCHSEWKKWQYQKPIYGIVSNTLFHYNPYFDDGMIMEEDELARKIVKGIVLAYYTFKEDLE